MKKLTGITLLLALSAIPQLEAQTFTEFPTSEEMAVTGGVQVAGISRNGRYVIGGTYIAGGCVFDVLEKKLLMVGASGVSDDGIAVGGFLKRDVHTGKVVDYLKMPPGNFIFQMTTGISADAKIVTGTVGADWTQLKPIYWEGSEPHILPFPTTEEVGTFKVNGCRAEGVSSDGSVIWGYFIANPNTNCLIIWERQPDGSYSYKRQSNIWEKLYEPLFAYKYDETTGTYDFVSGPNPYVRFQPYAMSGDGKLVLIRTQENTSEAYSPVKVGIYHVDTQEFELAPWSKDDLIGVAGDFDSRGIANDGTIVGLSFVSDLSSAVPFIMYPGEGPTYLNDAFPRFDRLNDYAWNSEMGLPYLLTVISEDARYIAGYSTDVITYYNEVGQSSQDFGFWGYVIDREGEGEPEENGVEAIEAEDSEPVYYSLDGIRVTSPERGLYIMQLPDGTTRKVAL